MPRRSVRRQVAEAAAGRAPELMKASVERFQDASQGTKLACLMAVQDFGDPRVMPPALLLDRYEECSAAVQAEIVLSLRRSESQDAENALEKLRGMVNDPRVLDAFDDPFFRSEVLSLSEPLPTSAHDAGAGGALVQPGGAATDDAVVAPGPPGQAAGDLGEQASVRIEEDSGEGFEPVEVVHKSVPPPIPERPPEGEPARKSRPLAAPPPMPDLDIAAGKRTATGPSPTTIGLYVIMLAVLVVMGIAAVYIVTGRWKREASAPSRPAGSESVIPAKKSPVPAAKPPVAPPQADIEPKPVESHIVAFESSASSQHRKYPASGVGDGNPSTVWQEDKGQKPLKQFLFLAFPEQITVIRIGVMTGYNDASGKLGDMFPLNNRLKKVEIAFSDGKVLFHEFADEREMQYFDLEPAHLTTSLKITVLEVYRGTWFYDNAIAEVEVWGYEGRRASD